MKNSLILFSLFNMMFLGFGLDLPQENPQELFLSDVSLKELRELRKDFDQQDLVFVSGITESKTVDAMDFAEQRKVELATLRPILPDQAILNIPPMKDFERFNFFRDFKTKFPNITFAGEPYTNAELAGMSGKIQKVLFPVVFFLILVGLLVLTKSLKASAYLFLSSLLGVGIGLSLVKILYHHSTILTTLTPLICFILTLGVQLHVVYGLSVFKDPKTFFDHKLQALSIMMVTTLIGFLSLSTSDLEGIRQLAISSSLSLLVTWLILLAVLKLTSPEFTLPSPKLLQRRLKIPGRSPFLGYSILLFLTVGGVLGIVKMPVLVEAINFFPKSHDIHLGYEAIRKDLGGTPQFDLVIKRKDAAPLEFEDYLKIRGFEDRLTDEFGAKKFLSLNHLVSFANEKYSGSSELPDNGYAYEALAGRIPEILRKYQSSERAYRLSYVTELLDNEQRAKTQDELSRTFKDLPPGYEIRFSGLTHLLLESQSHLVRSLIKSFLTSFLFIVTIFAVFSRKPSEIIVFGFLNLASILGGIFAMWLAGFSLNVSSIMTASISMGLVVDSTVHLIYAERLKETSQNIFHSTLVPIIYAHFLLFFGFAALSLEGFVPIRDFSLGLIFLLLIGLVSDLYVLPMVSAKRD